MSLLDELLKTQEVMDVVEGYRLATNDPTKSRAACYLAAKAGHIPTIRIGRKLYVPLRRLRALLEGNTNAS